MRTIRTVVICSSLLLTAQWAGAQTLTPAASDVAVQTPAPAAKPAPMAAPAEKSWSPLLQGGLVFQSAHAGILFGGGVLASPFHANHDLGILGDLNFVRFGGANNWMGSANLVYEMKPSGATAHPYLGGGLAIVRSGAGTAKDTSGNFQILGGVSSQMSGGQSVRGEVRLIFTSNAVTTLLLAGIRF